MRSACGFLSASAMPAFHPPALMRTASRCWLNAPSPWPVLPRRTRLPVSPRRTGWQLHGRRLICAMKATFHRTSSRPKHLKPKIPPVRLLAYQIQKVAVLPTVLPMSCSPPATVFQAVIAALATASRSWCSPKRTASWNAITTTRQLSIAKTSNRLLKSVSPLPSAPCSALGRHVRRQAVFLSSMTAASRVRLPAISAQRSMAAASPGGRVF